MKKIFFYIIFFFVICIFLYRFMYKTSEEEYIRFSSWGSQSETKILKSLIKTYEKETGVKIEFIHIPQNYFQKIQLLFASGLEPDVIFFNNQHIQMYIKANLLEDLSKYINTENFYDEAINCFKHKNGIYAIPRDISTLVIYYNKDIFKNLSLNIQEANDFKSFIELLKKIKRNNLYSINYEIDPIYWSYYLAANGGGILSDNKKNLIITDDKSIEAIKLYSDLINRYHVMPSKGEIGSKTTAQMFANKEIAMYLGGRWMIPKFREIIKFDWDIIAFPTTNENKVFADASGWAVAKSSKHKKEAIKFIRYLSNEKSLKMMAQTGLIIPANKNAAQWTINADIGKKPEHSIIFLNMLKNTKPTPVNENYAIVNDIIKEKVEIIFSGEEKPEDVFDKRTIKKLESLTK